jgi:predicted AlkP superfamily pyrophosphatase or phosphodiesterase
MKGIQSINTLLWKTKETDLDCIIALRSFLSIIQTLLLILVFVTIWNCSLGDDNEPEFESKPPIILISMDGFRWDYMDRTETPNMDYLASEGVRAEALIPVFPTFTFPNHLSIITGCYPENHGIISNTMWDPDFEEWYYIGEGAAPVREGKWYEAEPFWVTVEKAGLGSAIYHWPGSEAEIMGYRPSYYYIYDQATTNDEKIDQVLEWLDLPAGEKPSFIAMYFNEANYYGHRLGVAGEALDPIIQDLDENIGKLLAGLDQRNLLGEVTILVVADHGMVDIDDDKIMYLDDYNSFQILERYSLGSLVTLDPVEGMLDWVYNELLTSPLNLHLQVYKKEDTPEHLRYRHHPRIPPIICLPDESCYVTTHQNGLGGYKATHGYDQNFSSMQAVFLASGPKLKKGITVPKFKNIHIYDLMAEILEIEGAVNDGSLDSVRAMLIDQ